MIGGLEIFRQGQAHDLVGLEAQARKPRADGGGKAQIPIHRPQHRGQLFDQHAQARFTFARPLLGTFPFDGQSDPLGVVLSLRLYEVQRYLSLTAHWWSGFTLLAHAAAWQALPAAIRDVVERNADKFALLQRDDIEQINASGAAALAQSGMTVNTADAEGIRAALGDFYRRWQANSDPAAWTLLEQAAGGFG